VITDRSLINTRLLLIMLGGVGAGLILAFSVVGSGHFDSGSMGAGQDARAYWGALRSFPYALDAGTYGAYLYSPAYLQILSPVLSLPWQQFLAIWTVLTIATLLVLTGPVLFVFALPLAFFEIWGGNIHLLLALAIVLGFRWPATWSIVLLTKVTPGVGLLWFAARREWRALVIALGTTAAIVVGSWLIQPGLWQLWLDLLLREAGNPPAPGALAIPLIVRLPIAAALAVYAGHTNRKWLMPVVALISMPVLWGGSVSVLIGCVAIERERIESLVVPAVAGIPGWFRRRLERPRSRWIPEPEA